MLELLDTHKKRAAFHSTDGKTPGWLSVLPVACHHYDLSAIKSHDALALHYYKSVESMAGKHDGCGDLFMVPHTLDCQKYGLVAEPHTEVTIALGDTAAMIHSDVIKPATMREMDGMNEASALVADLAV